MVGEVGEDAIDMLYLLSVFFSVIYCVQGFAIEITKGDIVHLENSRTPNAGAALFPAIPCFQILAIGLAWLLKQCFQHHAFLVLTLLFLISSIYWWVSFARLRAIYKKKKAESAM